MDAGQGATLANPPHLDTMDTTTPAARLLEAYEIDPANHAGELQDSKAAMLSWAGRDGRYGLEDLRAILEGHGETMRSWLDACCYGPELNAQSVSNAEAVLAWLGY